MDLLLLYLINFNFLQINVIFFITKSVFLDQKINPKT